MKTVLQLGLVGDGANVTFEVTSPDGFATFMIGVTNYHFRRVDVSELFGKTCSATIPVKMLVPLQQPVVLVIPYLPLPGV